MTHPVAIKSSKHWHELRSKVIGSSDIACLFGLSMFKSKFTLWHEKAGNFKQEVSSNRVDAGNYLEEAIAKLLVNKLGADNFELQQNNHFYVSKSEILGATPDFFILDVVNNEHIVLEIKNMDYLQFKEKCLDGVPTTQYILQLQHQMHCSKVYKGILAIFVGGNDLKIFYYDYRPAIGAEMEIRSVEFLQSIKDNIPPSIDDPADLEVVKALHNSDNRHIDLSLDNEAVSACHDLIKATENRKHYEKLEKLSKAILLDKMDNANTAEIGDFRLRISVTKECKGTQVIPDMVGQYINAHKSSIRLNIKEV